MLMSTPCTGPGDAPPRTDQMVLHLRPHTPLRTAAPCHPCKRVARSLAVTVLTALLVFLGTGAIAGRRRGRGGALFVPPAAMQTAARPMAALRPGPPDWTAPRAHAPARPGPLYAADFADVEGSEDNESLDVSLRQVWSGLAFSGGLGTGCGVCAVRKSKSGGHKQPSRVAGSAPNL